MNSQYIFRKKFKYFLDIYFDTEKNRKLCYDLKSKSQ